MLKYKLIHTILKYSSQYNNISVYIADEDGVQLYLYRLAGNVEVGKIITVKGSMATHSGARQVTGGTFEEVGVHTCSVYTEATCAKPASCIVCDTAKDDVLLDHPSYTEATFTQPAKCTVCGTAKDDTLAAHNYVDGACSVCGAPESAGEATPEELVTFEFGANSTAVHVDGNELTADTSYTEGDYTLTLTGMSKVYGSAYDATGNSCIKLGTSKAVGTFTFTVDANVTSVVIKAAQYKAKKTIIDVNGTQYTLENASDNGAYDEIVIDTTTTKTITFTTVSGGVRAMVNSITYIGYAA